MRLRILSDLHLEFGGADLPQVDADVLLLAGDIHMGREGRKWIRSAFPDISVIYVMGNHEFYRHALPELTETLQRESAGSNIHVLENGSVKINEFTFLGCTLWTDFCLQDEPEIAMATADAVMSDYSLIRNSSENRLLRPKDTAALHRESRRWLAAELSKSPPERTIVVTHHAPSFLSEAPYHVDSPLAPAFASNLDGLVERSRIPLWVHGHTHFNADYRIGATRVLTNQRGYPDQLAVGFNPELIVEV